ncbi:MAG: Gfo/Idh/MocA family oxidoreductase [Bacteroidota bacterium]
MQPPITASVSVGVIGHSAAAQRRAAVVAAVPEAHLSWGPAWLTGPAGIETALADIDVACVATPLAERDRVATVVVQHGRHLFLEWPPGASVRGIQTLAQQAEEAAVEVGVSHPLRWHPGLRRLRRQGRVRLLTLTVDLADLNRWNRTLADAADVCAFLARSTAQRVEAEAVRAGAHPVACAFTLRFHNGAYAQVSLRRAAETAATLHVASPAGAQTVDLTPFFGLVPAPTRPENEVQRAALQQAPDVQALMAVEMRAFIQAVAHGRPAPAPLHETLQTLRLVERLQARLR